MAGKRDTAKTKTNDATNKLARRKSRREGTGDPIQAEYEALNHENLARLIDAVCSNGGTITFGLTRDGGAYYLNYWFDGVSDKLYIRPTEEPDTRILQELEFWLGD